MTRRLATRRKLKGTCLRNARRKGEHKRRAEKASTDTTPHSTRKKKNMHSKRAHMDTGNDTAQRTAGWETERTGDKRKTTHTQDNAKHAQCSTKNRSRKAEHRTSHSRDASRRAQNAKERKEPSTKMRKAKV
ncbi:hypothetical protein TRVL_06765 [Trypanosoma vivax]|nr:hypothetical protein TRVL_06765 [Trypanosoma vivax]